MTLTNFSFSLIYFSRHCWFQVDIFFLYIMKNMFLFYIIYIFKFLYIISTFSGYVSRIGSSSTYEIPFLFLGKYFPNTYCDLEHSPKHIFLKTLSTNWSSILGLVKLFFGFTILIKGKYFKNFLLTNFQYSFPFLFNHIMFLTIFYHIMFYHVTSFILNFKFLQYCHIFQNYEEGDPMVGKRFLRLVYT